MSTPPIRIMIGEDHPVMVDGLCTLLAQSERFTVVAVARSFAEVVATTREHSADVLILDLVGMGEAPWTVIQCLQRDRPRLKVVVYSSTIDLAPELIRAGAAGYVAKEEVPSVLIEAISAVVAGEVFYSPAVREYLEEWQTEPVLTPKEALSLKLLTQGLTTLEVAATMDIDPRTVQNYITIMLRKTRCASRVQLIDWYRRKYGSGS